MIHKKKQLIGPNRFNYIAIIYFGYWKSLILNKNQNLEIIAKREFEALIKNNLYKEFHLIKTCNCQKNHNIKVYNKKLHIF